MDPTTCPACGMRRFCIGNTNTSETDWNRKGNGKRLTEAQAMDRVCQYNRVAGCLTKGLPQPLPEPVARDLLGPEQVQAIAEQIVAEFG